MGFRDDEHALRLKKQALEEQLEEARTELDQARPQLERLETIEAELEAANAELERLRGPKPKPNPKRGRNILVPLGILALVAAVAVAVFLQFQERSNEALYRERDRQQARRHEEQAEAARDRAEATRATAEREAEASRAAAAVELARRLAALPDEVIRPGRVVAVSGPAPAIVEAECRLQVIPDRSPRFQARVVVECGGRTIYGAPGQGYVPCVIQRRAFIRCEDRNGTSNEGDPMLVLDLPTDRLVVSDGPELSWTVEIELEPLRD